MSGGGGLRRSDPSGSARFRRLRKAAYVGGNGGGGDDEVRKDAARAGSEDFESLRNQSIVEGTAFTLQGAVNVGVYPPGTR